MYTRILKKNTIYALLLLLTITFNAICLSSAHASVLPPTESDWPSSGLDPLLNIYELTRKPTIDGTIDPIEWKHATTFDVFDGGTQLGTFYAGTWDGVIYLATDWTVNDDSDPANSGNAWRLGTSNAPGPQNQGNSTWFEVYLQALNNEVLAKSAPDEAGLQSQSYEPAADFGIDAAAGFNNGKNWQYEVALGPAAGLSPPKPPPTKLAPSMQFTEKTIDTKIESGGHVAWRRVYNGALHCPPRQLPGGGVDDNNCAIGVPEPATIAIFSLGLAGMAFGKRRKLT